MEPITITTLVIGILSLVLHIRHFKSDCCSREMIHIDLDTDNNIR